jgi:DNA polymerase V
MDRRRRLMATMDRLNSEFGRNAVKTASSGTATPVWAIRRARKSPSYTTRWAELPQALA